MDEARDPVPPDGLEDVERADDVRLDVGARRHVRVRDRDEGREVEDDVDARGAGKDMLRVADVAEDDLGPPLADGSTERFGLLEPSRRALRGVEAEGADVGAVGQQPLDEMAADEAVAAGDEHGRTVDAG